MIIYFVYLQIISKMSYPEAPEASQKAPASSGFNLSSILAGFNLSSLQTWFNNLLSAALAGFNLSSVVPTPVSDPDTNIAEINAAMKELEEYAVKREPILSSLEETDRFYFELVIIRQNLTNLLLIYHKQKNNQPVQPSLLQKLGYLLLS